MPKPPAPDPVQIPQTLASTIRSLFYHYVRVMGAQKQCLEASWGFISLGMFQDALDELDSLAPELADYDEIPEIRIEAYLGLGHWESARVLAEGLAKRSPEDDGWWLSWAYALRRERSVEAAREVLTEALRIHPEVPLISYNLACYACVLGQIDKACLLLNKAFDLNPLLKRTALDDPDLHSIYGRELPTPHPDFLEP